MLPLGFWDFIRLDNMFFPLFTTKIAHCLPIMMKKVLLWWWWLDVCEHAKDLQVKPSIMESMNNKEWDILGYKWKDKHDVIYHPLTL